MSGGDAAGGTPAGAAVVERFATVSGRRWRYLLAEPAAGAAGGPAGGRVARPMLLFVHGAGGYAEKWRHQLPAVAAAGFSALAVDLPGHRGSDGPGCVEIAEYRDALAEFAHAAVSEPFVLAGHSMGGAIAQSFALRHPERLAGLVLVGTGARLRVHPETLERFRAGTVDRGFLSAGFGVRPDPALLDEEFHNLGHVRDEVRYGDFVACDRFDLMQEVAEISVPTLIVVGREDRMTPVKFSTFLAERIAGAEMVVIEGAGHYVMLERPDQTNAALLAFLRGLPR